MPIKCKIFWVILIFLAFHIEIKAQQIEKVVLNPSDTLFGHYNKIEPISGKIEQVLFLLPGFAQQPESIFTESKLPYVAAANNTLTIAMSGGFTLFINEETRSRIDAVMADVLEDFPTLKDKPWVMGGFSAGGTIALRYVEYAKQFPDKALVDFKGVFTVDSPVDLFDIWNYFERELAKNFSQAGTGEARFIMDLMERQEGKPAENKERYAELSPFNLEVEKGNEQYLIDTAVRVYHDVDISWQLKNRRRSVFDANYLAASEMINRLLLAGNERAEFMQSKLTGYRSNGMRHPHSWSIVDEVECVQWIKSLN